MKKYFAFGAGFAIALSIVAVVYAQVTVKVDAVCDTLENISLYTQKYQELPIVVAEADKSFVAFLANSKTGTWTVMQFNNEIGCILTTGTKFKVISGGTPI